jgi:hypothetical protein
MKAPRRCHFCDTLATRSKDSYGFLWYFCAEHWTDMVMDPRVYEDEFADIQVAADTYASTFPL